MDMPQPANQHGRHHAWTPEDVRILLAHHCIGLHNNRAARALAPTLIAKLGGISKLSATLRACQLRLQQQGHAEQSRILAYLLADVQSQEILGNIGMSRQGFRRRLNRLCFLIADQLNEQPLTNHPAPQAIIRMVNETRHQRAQRQRRTLRGAI